MSEDKVPYGDEGKKWERDAQELRALLDTAGYTQVAAANELDLSERAIRGYCSGREPVPRAVLHAMRWLVEHKPNQERWLTVHWKRAGVEVKKGDKFELKVNGKHIVAFVNGNAWVDGDIDELQRSGFISIHTSYSSDRFRLPDVELLPKELPQGSIYLLVPHGEPIAKYSLAIASTATARNFLGRNAQEGTPHECWLARRVAI